jgi:hypothetical protein
MVRHDLHGHGGEPDPPGTPGLRALGAMAAAARRAREVQEGGPPTRAVEIPLDDEPPSSSPSPAPHPAAESLPREASARRSPLEVAVWIVAAMILVAAGALAVSLATSGNGGGPSTTPPASAQNAAPTTPHGTPGGKGSGPSTSPGSSNTTTTTTTTTALPNASGPPVIAALNPASGSAGQAIQVAGANFLSSSGQIIATFDGQVASTRCPAQNTCSVTVPPAPPGSGTAQVVITTAGGTSNTMTFTYS